MKLKYPYWIEKERMGYAAGISMGISPKIAIEITGMLRGLSVEKAKETLSSVIAMKRPVPYRRFNADVGHKKGIGPGRYPVKASSEILRLLKSAESNAVDKGLNPAGMLVSHISANRAPQQWKFGRKRRRKAKSAHVYIVLEEGEKKPKLAENEHAKGSIKKTEKEGKSKAQKKAADEEGKKPPEKAAAKGGANSKKEPFPASENAAGLGKNADRQEKNLAEKEGVKEKEKKQPKDSSVEKETGEGAGK